MSSPRKSLALDATPQAARTARDWVATRLRELGRDDLVDNARLGVSELVSNALLHATPPFTVRLRGSLERPRIEVSDLSTRPPEPTTDTDDDAAPDPWPNRGRGLHLLAWHAERWGADLNVHEGGKVVWFEPADAVRDTPATGDVFDFDRAVPPETGPDRPEVTIRLLHMPVRMFIELRHHINDLSRELRLLALADPDRYPVAAAASQLFLEAELQRRRAVGTGRLEQAIADGLTTVDLAYRVAPEAPATMTRMAELLEELYETLGDDGLLAVRPSEPLLALQRWYLGEFGRQGRGEEPVRWDGPTDADVRDTP